MAARRRENVKVTGCLPIEREALQRFVDAGYVDTFRHFNPAEKFEGLKPEQRPYSWWTYRAGARDRNIGWRIDYHFVNSEFVPSLKSAEIRPEVMGSDHCPVTIDLRD